MNLSEFKNSKRGRTWVDLSNMFNQPVMKLYRWAREGHEVRKVDGKWTIFKKIAVEREEEAA